MVRKIFSPISPWGDMRDQIFFSLLAPSKPERQISKKNYRWLALNVVYKTTTPENLMNLSTIDFLLDTKTWVEQMADQLL